MRKEAACNCAPAGETVLRHGDRCPRGHQVRARHSAAVKREEKQHLRAIERFKSSIRSSARKMAEDLVDKEIEELLQHALAGRGFRLTLMICERNGMPWTPESEQPQERLIISPNEQ